jgi:hypothetical protein
MLQLLPNLMAKMKNDHFLAALDCEPSFARTSVELELMRRLDELAANELPEDIEERLKKTYEVDMEQSEFRANLIREIQLLCEQPGSKEDLISAINKSVSNSYVEL